MNKKITIALLSILAVLFLTAQTCTTGLAAECTAEGDILCDDADAYECGYNAYGYYVSRASEYDVEYYGAEDTTTDTDEDGLTDYDEVNMYGTDPEDRDSDDDGALDGEEVVADTDPMDATSGEVTSTRSFPTRTMSSSDSDRDGLTDIEEITTYSTDPDDVDSDDDYLSDYDEINTHGTNPNSADTDGDGYDDGFEVRASSDPLVSADIPAARDRDGDLMPDFFEIAFGFDPLDYADAIEDYDADSLTNYEEYLYQTDPTNSDTDGDTYSDYDEINVYGTNPRNAADYPVMMSAIPITEFRTFPMSMATDTDGDGLTDYQESNLGTDETSTDTDRDGLTDYDEAITYSTDPLDDDTDSDGLPDGWEVTYGFNPNNAGTASGDYDSDGLTNLEEYEAGTDPTVAGLVADCGVSEMEIYTGIDATFDGSASTGDIDFYEWDWDDGTADTSVLGVGAVEAETHEYHSEGEYSATLTITGIEGDTDQCTVNVIVKNTDEEIESLQLFKLKDFEYRSGTTTGEGVVHFTSISEESSHYKSSKSVKNMQLQESDSRGYYLDFYSSDYSPRDVIFTDADYLKPTNWIIVQLEGYMITSYRDKHQYLLTKTTDTCGEPLYAILTYESKYVFTIMIEGTEYTLKSDSEITGDWQEVRGVYTGDEVQLYIDGVLEDSEIVFGEIGSSATAGSLVLGYDTACADYQYYGYIDNIYIYGE